LTRRPADRSLRGGAVRVEHRLVIATVSKEIVFRTRQFPAAQQMEALLSLPVEEPSNQRCELAR